MKRNRQDLVWLIAAGFVASTLACNLLSASTPAPATSAPTEETAVPVSPTIPPTPPAGVYAAAFSSYPSIAVDLPTQFSGGYTLPVDLSQVRPLAGVDLSQGQSQLLSENGFVVAPPVPGKYREFYQIYESIRYDEQPAFITTDSVFHIYHLIFDKMLRDLETAHFIDTLESLTTAMQAASQDQLQQLQGTSLEEPARRNLAFFTVAAQLLELPGPVPPSVADLVSSEMALINAHAGAEVSPIWDRDDLPNDKKLIEDYSQYVPRGHYTRSDELKRYFKAMMWYGRMTMRARDAFETRRALLVVQAIRDAAAADGTPATELWQRIYEPTAFIVGKADDLSYQEYGVLSDSIFGASPDLTAFADDAKVEAFRQAVFQLPPPQVNSMWVWITEDKTEATQGFRFMGQRFTLDAYVFGQMIWRNVGTLGDPRGLPKGLDFFAAMGSDEALSILDGMGETHYENFNTQMDKVRGEIGDLELDSWTQNLYWNWLYALQPVIAVKDERYPAFMGTQAWVRKDLQTALGSWTELKHDTILYAKQVMAEMGGGGPAEPPPHGWVEPNPEAFARLLALAQMTRDGLDSRGLLTDLTRANLENLMSELEFLKKAAESELAGQVLSDDDYWHIQYFGGVLEQLTLAAADTQGPADRNLEDQKAALIADVATGLYPGFDLAALEEAIGAPTEIYVILPDNPWRVAIGAVYTYYEFPVAVADRMTDEQWQAKVEAGDTPPQPDWTSSFVSP
jgi:hypothetical protein